MMVEDRNIVAPLTGAQTNAIARFLFDVPQWCRYEMKQHLMRQATVRIYKQTECTPDVKPFALAVADLSEDAMASQNAGTFWIDCFDTPEAAAEFAASVGLQLLSSEDR